MPVENIMKYINNLKDDNATVVIIILKLRHWSDKTEVNNAALTQILL